MGPNETRARLLAARHTRSLSVWSRRVARALVRSAQVLDDDPAAVYPYAGRVADVHRQLAEVLMEFGPRPDPLVDLRARIACRPVGGGALSRSVIGHRDNDGRTVIMTIIRWSAELSSEVRASEPDVTRCDARFARY